MTRRTIGALLAVLAATMVAGGADAAQRPGREWKSGRSWGRLADPSMPLFFRSSAGTTWVRVHDPGQSPCAPADTLNSPDGQTIEHVWCFEGAGGDSTWPANPQSTRKETFDHWAAYNPPEPQGSKWHVTQRHPGPSTGNFNAWAGCDSLGTNPACADVAFWVFQDGYGADWNYSLVLDMSSQNATAGGTLEFDLRYDTECHYDYLYLEYLDTATGFWELVTDGDGTPAVFNGVSGVYDFQNGGTGRACGTDYFGSSDQADLGGGNVNVNGMSSWLTDVQFPLPAQVGGLQLRWRAFSDPLWNDADGQGDTDGLGAIDNVSITLAGSGVTVSDNFETGDFTGISVSSGTAAWFPGSLEGNTYDGWHLEFDPMYKNKGNTCTFSDDWMWAAKPATSSIPENGFSYHLVSPVIDCDGWTGAVCEYSTYQCMPDDRNDVTNQLVRLYDSSIGQWGLWQDIDGFVLFGGCDFWNFNNPENLTPYLGASIDSLQVAWEALDTSQDGTFDWGKHGGVQYLIDNVSFGRFDSGVTQFVARAIDIFTDTFSLADPAHSSQLGNGELADWVGAGGSRIYVDADSLSVVVNDIDGITEGNVVLWWRADSGPGTPFGAWSPVTMDLGVRAASTTSDEGTYRAIVGRDDGGPEDMTAAGDGRIWLAGTTVEYYVKATDDLGGVATFPATASESPATYLEFSLLPFDNTTPEQGNSKILLVDDYSANTLDFEASVGFDPNGGAGYGAFATNSFRAAEDFYEESLADLGLAFDKYDVVGAGSSAQSEPTGVSNVGAGLGGFMDDFGNPYYDAVIWFQGNQAQYAFADTTRMELMSFLENGGKLFTCGDDIAMELGTGGNNSDSTLGFLGDYLGTSFPSINDDTTDEKVLNVTGAAGTPYEGLLFGLYGECPIRQNFDRLTLAPTATGSENSVLMTYTNGGAADEGRASVIKNVRTFDGGTAVLAAFDLTRMLSRESRTCLLGAILENEMGLLVPNGYPCRSDGVGAPVVAASGFGFALAPASPNPFRSSTAIRFSLAKRERVRLEVYNILGQRIRTLVDEVMEPDAYVREWDGRSEEGDRVSSGIYFYRMIAGPFTDTRKTVLLQ